MRLQGRHPVMWRFLLDASLGLGHHCVKPIFFPRSSTLSPAPAKNIVIAHQSRRLMFFGVFLFPDESFTRLYNLTLSPGLQLPHGIVCVCVWLNQIFNLCNWNGWSNSARAFPQVFMLCVCVRERRDGVVFGRVWNDVNPALHRGGWRRRQGSTAAAEIGVSHTHTHTFAASCVLFTVISWALL